MRFIGWRRLEGRADKRDCCCPFLRGEQVKVAGCNVSVSVRLGVGVDGKWIAKLQRGGVSRKNSRDVILILETVLEHFPTI